MAGSQELAGRALYYERNAEIGLLIHLDSSSLQAEKTLRREGGSGTELERNFLFHSSPDSKWVILALLNYSSNNIVAVISVSRVLQHKAGKETVFLTVALKCNGKGSSTLILVMGFFFQIFILGMLYHLEIEAKAEM